MKSFRKARRLSCFGSGVNDSGCPAAIGSASTGSVTKPSTDAAGAPSSPQELSGLYTAEEMSQASSGDGVDAHADLVEPVQPSRDEGDTLAPGTVQLVSIVTRTTKNGQPFWVVTDHVGQESKIWSSFENDRGATGGRAVGRLGGRGHRLRGAGHQRARRRGGSTFSQWSASIRTARRTSSRTRRRRRPRRRGTHATTRSSRSSRGGGHDDRAFLRLRH